MTRPARSRLLPALTAVAAGLLAMAPAAGQPTVPVRPAAPAAAVDPLSPLPPAGSGLAPGNGSTMHGDGGSSKAFPYAGPGAASRDRVVSLAHACPTIVHSARGTLMALCTGVVGRAPRAYLIDRATGKPLADLALAKGSLLGGVYAYLDDTDRLVMVDGTRSLLRIGAHRNPEGDWKLSVDQKIPIGSSYPADDAVTALMPDAQRRVWFATAHGTVGTVGLDGDVRTTRLPMGEQVANSVSVSAAGTAVTSSHALYLLRADAAGQPSVAWRQPYDRGPGRKPGQLSWGSGATPVFFGPRSGTDYVVITDNAAPRMNVEVRESATGRQVCRMPVFTDRPAAGSENGPVAAGRSVFLVDTYGYDYPALPEGAGPSVPKDAPFAGGLTRIDVNPDGAGCTTRWATRTRSGALPKISTTERVLYTIEQQGDGLLRRYCVVRVNADTGEVLSRLPFGSALQDPLQMSGTVTPDGTFWQGTITGYHRLARA